MFGLGVPEIAVIGIIVALIWGPKQLPKLAKGLGQTVKEFRNAGKELRAAQDEHDED